MEKSPNSVIYPGGTKKQSFLAKRGWDEKLWSTTTSDSPQNIKRSSSVTGSFSLI